MDCIECELPMVLANGELPEEPDLWLCPDCGREAPASVVDVLGMAS